MSNQPYGSQEPGQNRPPQYWQPQNRPPQFGQPQNRPPQFGQPQNRPPQFGQPQNQPPQFGQPQYQAGPPPTQPFQTPGWAPPTLPVKPPRKWYQKKRVLIPVSLLALMIIATALNGGNRSPQAAAPASSSLTTAPVTQATTSAPPAPTTSAPQAPKTTAPAAPTQYNAIAARDFKLLAKDPDAYSGKAYVIYGRVTQFDAATGNDGFLASTGATKAGASEWYLYEQNSALVGDAAKLSKIVEGDLFEAKVLVVGSFSYDTQAGGNTTVPRFQVMEISVYGTAE